MSDYSVEIDKAIQGVRDAVEAALKEAEAGIDLKFIRSLRNYILSLEDEVDEIRSYTSDLTSTINGILVDIDSYLSDHE